MHDGVVEVGVEGQPQGRDLGDPQLLQGGLELGHDHLHALGVGLVGGLLLQGPLQVVEDRQEFLHRVGLGGGPGVLLFLLAPLAVVVIFRQQTQVFVLLLPDGGLHQLFRAGLFGGLGFGLRGLLGLRLLALLLPDLVQQDLRLFVVIGFLLAHICVCLLWLELCYMGLLPKVYGSSSPPSPPGGGISPLPNILDRPSAK